MTAPDLLKVLDVAYRFDGDDERWLGDIAEALRPELDVGCGIHAFFIQIRSPGDLHIDRPVAVGLAPDWAKRWREDWWRAFMLASPPATLHAMMTHSVCNYSVELWRALSAAIPGFGAHLETHAALLPDAPELARARERGMGYPDSLNVLALDASGDGVVFAANRPTPSAVPPPRAFVRTWSQLATHIAAALRLRKKALGHASLDSAEAVLDDRRRVVHATGEARTTPALEAIRQAAVAVSRARPDAPGGVAAASDDGDERAAIEAWSSLTAGRWTVLDQFDRDGRRYFVARPNAPAPTPNEALSLRERQVLGALALGHSNKLIAYELGLHPSTVSNHLASAAKKLGCDSRVALARRARTLDLR